MRKIMFNENYGLTKAVIEGKKTLTCRIIKGNITSVPIDERTKQVDVVKFCEENGVFPFFNPFEELAVAQRYEKLMDDVWHGQEENFTNKILEAHGQKTVAKVPGWFNKEFVKSELMPHRVIITDIRVERMQDISEEECMREGVVKWMDCYIVADIMENRGRNNVCFVCFDTPREAFAALIDRINGKGTWESNPWVWVYEFRLTK